MWLIIAVEALWLHGENEERLWNALKKDTEDKLLHSFAWKFVKISSEWKAYGFEPLESMWQPRHRVKLLLLCHWNYTKCLEGLVTESIYKKLTKEPGNSLLPHKTAIWPWYHHATPLRAYAQDLMSKKRKDKYLIEFVSQI